MARQPGSQSPSLCLGDLGSLVLHLDTQGPDPPDGPISGLILTPGPGSPPLPGGSAPGLAGGRAAPHSRLRGLAARLPFDKQRQPGTWPRPRQAPPLKDPAHRSGPAPPPPIGPVPACRERPLCCCNNHLGLGINHCALVRETLPGAVPPRPPSAGQRVLGSPVRARSPCSRVCRSALLPLIIGTYPPSPRRRGSTQPAADGFPGAAPPPGLTRLGLRRLGALGGACRWHRRFSPSSGRS